MSEERADCGVCGVPTEKFVQVTDDGYEVPRCTAHAMCRPYQAESRLAQAASRVEALEGALRGIESIAVDKAVPGAEACGRIFALARAALIQAEEADGD